MSLCIALTSTYRFGTEAVDGTWMSDEKIRCVSPAQSEGIVEVEIKTSADESFTSNKVCSRQQCFNGVYDTTTIMVNNECQLVSIGKKTLTTNIQLLQLTFKIRGIYAMH